MTPATEHRPIPRFVKMLMAVILICGAFYTILYFFLSIPRLLFPYEIEWLEGGMLDQAARILHGKTLFVAPSIEMVNWLYQPIYYYVVAGAMHLVGATYFAGRLVSFASIIICAVMILTVLRSETGSWWYAFIGSSLLFASYGLTGYWYEIAHVDTLMLAFLLTSIAMICIRRSTTTLVLSALFLALAFFTKQQAVFYVLPVALWLFLSDRRKAIIFALSVLVFLGAGVFLFSLDGGRWYYYFTFTVPQSMGSSFHWDKILTVLPFYLFTQFAAGSVLIIFFWITGWQKRKEWLASVTGLVTLFAIAATIQLGMHLGHTGTYRNVAMPLASAMAILIPIAAYHLMNRAVITTKYVVLAALVIQFIGLYYSFRGLPMVIITKKAFDAAEAFNAELRNIPGPVFLPHHNFYPFDNVGKRFAHLVAAEDCRDVGDSTAKRFWAEWEHAYSTERYAAIIVDEGPFRPYDSIPGYTFVRQVNLGSNPFVTRAAEGTSTPRYLYLPKH